MKPTFAVHSYPWYISDWTESETRIEFTLSERGLYRELIDRCYREGSIPDDERKLIALCACDPKEFRKAWPKVREKFERTGDGRLEHHRITEVLSKLENWNEARRKGGYSRQRSSSAKAGAKAEVDHSNTSGTSSSPSSSTTSSSSPSTIRSDGAAPLPSDTVDAGNASDCFTAHGYTVRMRKSMFDEIAARMYKRHAKKDGRIMFEQALAQVLSESMDNAESVAKKIEANHAAWCEYWRRTCDGPQFWPPLAKWIDTGKYADDLPDSEPEEEKPIDRYADLRHLPPDEMQHQIGLRERAEYDALVAQNAKRRGAA